MKVKNTLLVLVIILITTSCATSLYSGYYNIGLSKVETPKSKDDRYGETTITNLGSKDTLKFSYEDNYINITWTIGIKQFAFNLKNKTDFNLKIIWDEAVYVDIDGSSSKVMHAGIKYVDRDASHPASIVAKKSYIDDMVLPTKNVYMNSIYSGWQEKAFLPIYAKSKEILLNDSKNYIGKQVKIILPIQIEDTVNEYEFVFDVSEFTPLWKEKMLAYANNMQYTDTSEASN